MFKYLERLRAQPEKQRRKSVLAISLGITVIIALFWGIGLSFKLGKTDFSIKTDASAEATKSAKTPSITETFSSFVDQLGEILNNTKSIENTASNSPESLE